MVPLALLAIRYLTRDWLFAIYCGIFFAVLWEWCDIARISAVWAKCLYSGLFVSAAIVLQYVDVAAIIGIVLKPVDVSLDDWIVGGAVAFWAFGIFAVLFFKSMRRVLSNRVLLFPAGGIIAVGSILAFSEIDASVTALIAVIAAAGVTDSLAYIIGNFFGTRQLHPDVSPNKTWEGTIGGFIGGLLCLVLFDQVLGWIEFQTFWLWPVVITFAIFGDLFESALKRTADIKDSGNLLPGHGGFFDRFDSMMALSVATYFCAA